MGENEGLAVDEIFFFLFISFFGPLLLSAYAKEGKRKADGAPKLEVPVRCTPQVDCFMQNYVDIDPSKTVKDFACGKAAYDGHKGLDIRLISTAQMNKGVDVLAAAGGLVKGVRNHMPDHLVQTAKDAAYIRGKECGNGLVVDHGHGWETQYCHMKRGSLRVKPGQKLKTGDTLGLVGLSGHTQFPHLHLEVRHKGQVVDPYLGLSKAPTNQCGAGPQSLLSSAFFKAFPYKSGQFIEAGFVNKVLKQSDYELAKQFGFAPHHRSPIVFFARAINLKKGDRILITIHLGKKLFYKHISSPLTRYKATYAAQGGRKFTAERPFPPGIYKGVAHLIRGGKRIEQTESTFTLED